MMTNEQYKEETFSLLNSIRFIPKRNRITEDEEFKIAVAKNQWEGAYERVYGLMFGIAKNRTELKRQLKRKKSLDDGSMFA